MYIFCVYLKVSRLWNYQNYRIICKQITELPSMKLYDEGFKHHVVNMSGMNTIL